jgi:hypothetical protein
VYPLTKELADGTELDGSKDKYTLTFAKDQYPPVNAFWSVTMYDGKTQLLIKNPIDRYLINSPMLSGMKKNKDGSLTLHIQKASRTRSPTGCRPPTGRSTSRCGSTGRRTRRRRSCLLAKARGSRRLW